MTSSNISILQLNTEGLTRTKRDLIRHIADENNISVILLQETHAVAEENLIIEGFNTLAFIPNKHHGLATYAREGTHVTLVQRSPEDNRIEWICITIGDVSVINVYKPPPETVSFQHLPRVAPTTIACGDFNSRNTFWGYPDCNANGETIAQWAEASDLYLLYDANDNKSFFSGRHKTWTNPDLCFVSNSLASSCKRSVLDKFPRSGHCPIIISTEVGMKINSLRKKRWNFRKANWSKFTTLVESLSSELPDPSGPASETYKAFTTMLSSAAKSSIPRGRRNSYIPCWDSECEAAFKASNAASIEEKPTKSDHLMKILGEKRQARWEETVTSIDFTHSSRKTWSTINHLSGQSSKPKPCLVTANSIATVLVENGKWKDKSTDAKRHTYEVNRGIREATASQPASSGLSGPVTLEQLMDATMCLKNGKAPGMDLVHTEFLKHLGFHALDWLRLFLSNCLATLTIPAIWRKAQVVAILKPKKPAEDPKSYRPISLLCIPYKLMERVILARINNIVEENLPQAQAGFRKGRSTTDQIVRLVNDIEAAFQRKEKVGVVFIDLTAAYDTVWHRGLYLKLLQMIPDVKLVKFIMLMLQNRSFYVTTPSGERSRNRRLRNGLPQGSVLAPILFNIYTADYPDTSSAKYLYADDGAIAAQGKTYEEIQRILEADLITLCKYLRLWHLRVSMSKTVCSMFHLSTRLAKKELVVTMEGKKLKFDPVPVYLGVTLDRSLTFGLHLKNAANKASKRVNLIRKLCGLDWGASFTTLRTSVLALVYSTAEYAAAAWSHSVHTKLVDVVLNEAMRIISGTLKPTPTEMLPILSGIHPPKVRRDFQTLKLAEKALESDGNNTIPVPLNPPQRIARQHFARRAAELLMSGPASSTWMDIRWRDEWRNSNTNLHSFISTPSPTPPGHTLPRKAWIRLNRLRTGWGRTQSFQKLTGASTSDICQCGATQTVQHIINECPTFGSPYGFRGLVQLDQDTLSWLVNVAIPV